MVLKNSHIQRKLNIEPRNLDINYQKLSEKKVIFCTLFHPYQFNENRMSTLHLDVMNSISYGNTYILIDTVHVRPSLIYQQLFCLNGM